MVKHKFQTINSFVIILIIILSNPLLLNCSYIKTQSISVEKTENIKEIAQFDDNYGYFYDITGEKDIVVVSSNDRIYLFNISNITNPIIETEIPIYDISDVTLNDDLLYVIQNNQFQIYTLANNSLILHNNITFSVSCSKLTIKNNYAYIMLTDENMSIIDITNPDSIEVKANFSVDGQLKDFCVYDNYMYILNANNDIIVKNVTDIINLSTVLIHNVGTASYFNDITINNGYLYAINGTGNQLIAYNCTLPTIFEYVSACEGCSGYSLAIKDDLALLTGSSNLQIVNITDVENLVKIADEQLLSGTPGIKEIFIRNSTLFVTELTDGLTIIDISNSSHPTKIINFSNGGYSQDIVTYNDCLIVSDYNGGIEVLNFSENNEIVKITQYKDEIEKGYLYNRILNIDDIFYVTTGTQDLLLLEMMENKSLTKIGEYHDPQSVFRKMVSNGRYLFANIGNGIVVVDVRNKYEPTRMNFYYDGSAIQDITIDENMLYVLFSKGEEQGIKIYDVSDPMNQRQLGYYQIENQSVYNAKIELLDNDLVIALEEKMILLDVRNSEQIVKITDFDKREMLVNSLIRKGNYLCIGMTEGISILDISKKTNPKEIAFYYDGGTARSIIIQDNKMFIADGLDGVEVLETTFQFEPKNNTLIYILFSVGILSIGGIITVTIIYKRKKLAQGTEI